MPAKAFARICCLVSLIMVVLGADRSAFSAKDTIKYVSIRQSSGTLTPGHNETLGWRETHLLECRGLVCTGRMPLVLAQKVYYYNAVATIVTGDGKYIQMNIDLHPIVPGCGPQRQPNLTAIFTSLPWARQAHVTVPCQTIRQPQSDQQHRMAWLTQYIRSVRSQSRILICRLSSNSGVSNVGRKREAPGEI